MRKDDTELGCHPLAVSVFTRTKCVRFSSSPYHVKLVAPDVMIRPEVGTFGSLDYFRIREILAAATPAKDALKHKISQWLG